MLKLNIADKNFNIAAKSTPTEFTQRLVSGCFLGSRIDNEKSTYL